MGFYLMFITTSDIYNLIIHIEVGIIWLIIENIDDIFTILPLQYGQNEIICKPFNKIWVSCREKINVPVYNKSSTVPGFWMLARDIRGTWFGKTPNLYGLVSAYSLSVITRIFRTKIKIKISVVHWTFVSMDLFSILMPFCEQ